MPQEADRPCPGGATLVLCDCGTVVLACGVPNCQAMHTWRRIPACGACTATGGMPVEEPTLLERAARVLAGGPGTYSKSPQRYPQGIGPSALVSGEGCYVTSDDGQTWLDTVSALGTNLLGYGNETVHRAVREQLLCGTSFSMLHPVEVSAAERLCAVWPNVDMCRWMRNGSDATGAAVRLARAITGRRHVVMCGYHGASSNDWYAITTRQQAGVLQENAFYSHQIPWGDFSRIPPVALEDLAAVIVEVPPMAWDGGIHGASTTLQAFGTLAHTHGALFIVDDVITALRYGLGGAQAYYETDADLVTGGKALANGLPLAVLGGRREFMQVFDHGDVFCSYTYGGETTALAACCAVLDVLETTEALSHLQIYGNAFGGSLARLLARYELPVTLRGNFARMVLRWHDSAGPGSAEILRTIWMTEHAKRHILYGIGAIFPTTTWGLQEVNALLSAAEEVCFVLKRHIEAGTLFTYNEVPIIGDVLAVRS